jgi:hypothetical protein
VGDNACLTGIISQKPLQNQRFLPKHSDCDDGAISDDRYMPGVPARPYASGT